MFFFAQEQINRSRSISSFRSALGKCEIAKNIDEYEAYRTEEKFIPELEVRKRVEVVVNHSDSKKL